MKKAVKEATDFVDLESFRERDESVFRFDIRYARADNFLGRPVYALAKAFLQREVAEDLLRVSARLSRQGCGLLVFDAYRPWSVTKVFYEEASEEARAFLANPERGSIHNRGCAIDCGLFSRESGEPLPMPSDFDEFSERAYADYEGGEKSARENRDLLIESMHAEGFHVLRNEWWHFNHPASGKYPLYDWTFEELVARAASAPASK